MISAKKIKILVIAVALGLVIGVQNMIPVNAATYSLCGDCGGTVNTTLVTRYWNETEQCTLREHYTLDCKIVTTKYQKINIRSCPKGCFYQEDPIGNPESGESRHVFQSR